MKAAMARHVDLDVNQLPVNAELVELAWQAARCRTTAGAVFRVE